MDKLILKKMADKAGEMNGMERDPVMANGFLKYMRDFRILNGHLDLMESAKEGTKAWRQLTNEQKEQYQYRCHQMGYNNRQQQQQDQTVGSILMEKGCCPKKKPKKCCPKKPACPKPCKKAKKSCKKPKKACSKPKKPCARKCNPGPMTNNGYLNFVRSFREANCGLKPREMIIKAARAWCALPEEKKDHYRRLACKVTTSTRHKKRAVCKKGNCK